MLNFHSIALRTTYLWSGIKKTKNGSYSSLFWSSRQTIVVLSLSDEMYSGAECAFMKGWLLGLRPQLRRDGGGEGCRVGGQLETVTGALNAKGGATREHVRMWEDFSVSLGPITFLTSRRAGTVDGGSGGTWRHEALLHDYLLLEKSDVGKQNHHYLHPSTTPTKMPLIQAPPGLSCS